MNILSFFFPRRSILSLIPYTSVHTLFKRVLFLFSFSFCLLSVGATPGTAQGLSSLLDGVQGTRWEAKDQTQGSAACKASSLPSYPTTRAPTELYYLSSPQAGNFPNVQDITSEHPRRDQLRASPHPPATFFLSPQRLAKLWRAGKEKNKKSAKTKKNSKAKLLLACSRAGSLQQTGSPKNTYTDTRGSLKSGKNPRACNREVWGGGYT